MGKCKFCGEPAGILMDYHPACKDEYERAKGAVERGSKELFSAVTECLFHPQKHKRITDALAILPKAVGHPDPLDILFQYIDEAIDGIRKSGKLLTPEMEAAYVAFINSQGYTREVADRLGTFRKVVLLIILRELAEGVIPNRCEVTSQLPFVFLKNESLLLVTTNVELYEQRVKREYSGQSSGASIKVLPGWWVRVGDSTGSSVSTLVTERIDIGMLALTTKHIFFSSGKKSSKIRFDKIISSELMADGIRITKDGANAKPQWFVTSDGWFYHKAIALLSQA